MATPLYANAVATTLAAPVANAGATTMAVASVTGWPTITAGTYLPAAIIDTTTTPETVKEIVYVTSVSGTTATVTRQAEDAARFPAGALSSGLAFVLVSTAGALAAALQAGNNLSDLASAATARTNLGLGTAATQSSTAFDAAGAATAAQTASLQKSSNLSDLASAATARTNLGLGTAATQATSAFDAAGAATAAQAASAPRLVRTAVKTSAYAAAAGDLVPVDTTSGSVTVTLPTAPASGSRVAVKHIILGGANTVTLACGGSDVFNKTSGSTSVTLTLVNQLAQVQYDAGIWTVVADDIPLSGLDARYDASGAASTVSAASLQKASNLSDVASATTARTNLGLAALATKATATVPGDLSASGSPSSSTFLRGDGAWATPAGGGNGGLLLPLISGRYTATGDTTGTASGTLNRLYLYPFVIERAATLNELGINVGVAGTAIAIRIGVYSDVSGLPSALLVEATSGATLDGTTTGYKGVSGLSTSLSAGRVWFALVQQGTTQAGITQVGSTWQSIMRAYITDASTPGNAGGSYSYWQTGVSGAMPGTLTLTGSISDYAPRFLMKAT